MTVKYEYVLQLREDVRRYVDGTQHEGWAWELVQTARPGDRRHYYSIVSSPGVFNDEDEAKQDALRKLSILRCPIDRPLDHAIKWHLENT
ncbi:hypothetical protein F4X86_03985 [Candidatus Saccharibacteria bacterium]|nr:hypothetical protein [Candidatus Saccharibacteria bacterium]